MDKDRVCIKRAVSGKNVTGIATDKDRFDVGAYQFHLIAGLFAVLFQHDRVNEYKIDALLVGNKLLDRILAVDSLDHPVTEVAEDVYRQLSQGGIVLANQNGLSAAPECC